MPSPCQDTKDVNGFKEELNAFKLYHELSGTGAGSGDGDFIIKLLGVDEPRRTLTFELAPHGCLGDTMQMNIRAPTPVPERPALIIQLAIARGVAHLHGLGIVHQDLKPENVFMMYPRDDIIQAAFATESSEAPGYMYGSAILRIGDLGLSVRTDRACIGNGTGYYRAPESGFIPDRLRSTGLLKSTYQGKLNDMWSLGVTLHELVRGNSLFSAFEYGAEGYWDDEYQVEFFEAYNRIRTESDEEIFYLLVHKKMMNWCHSQAKKRSYKTSSFALKPRDGYSPAVCELINNMLESVREALESPCRERRISPAAVPPS